jgi:hypothetical protein
MKKLFSILAVLLVATALFAGVTVKAGGTFAYANFKSPVDKNSFLFSDEMNLKTSGFGFDAGVLADIADNLAAYAEFRMVFPKDADFKEGNDDWEKLSDDSKGLKIHFYNISTGVAYKLDFNAVKLAVGAGVSMSSLVVHNKIEEAEFKISHSSIGLNVLFDAKYMFAENIGAGVTINPQLGLFDIASGTSKMGELIKNDKITGIKVNFALPVTVGVSYTF